jgi:hypothetical protein
MMTLCGGVVTLTYILSIKQRILSRKKPDLPRKRRKSRGSGGAPEKRPPRGPTGGEGTLGLPSGETRRKMTDKMHFPSFMTAPHCGNTDGETMREQ